VKRRRFGSAPPGRRLGHCQARGPAIVERIHAVLLALLVEYLLQLGELLGILGTHSLSGCGRRSLSSGRPLGKEAAPAVVVIAAGDERGS